MTALTRKVLAPLERFLQVEASSGIVLLVAAVLALLWANSPWGAVYESTWHATHFVVNDVLMTIFFLVVGMEIRREMHDGALASVRAASVPVVAALGGVAVPALIYLALNSDPELRQGWAVPMATDIAFAVGVLSLLGSRVPGSLRALLLALAIIDDIFAILVIAFFYSTGVALIGLLISAAGIAGVFLFRALNIRNAWAYILPGAVLWAGLLQAQVHPTLAGVILGLLIPLATNERVEAALHAWVAFGIMPLFALANAGVRLDGVSFSDGAITLAAGIFFGLVVGKPLGIVAITFLTVKAGLLKLPGGITWPSVAVLGCLAGIGFTMSIFLAGLAFADGSRLATAKLAVLLASAVSGIVGLVSGMLILRAPAAAAAGMPQH